MYDNNTLNKCSLKKNVISSIIIVILAMGLVLLSGSTTNTAMNYPKTVYAQSGSQPQVSQVFTFNEKSRPPNAPQLCASLASVVKGKAVPDYNLCDVIVYRQAPPIVRNDGIVLNNYSGFGHYIEFAPAVINITTPFGEWALLDSEVVPVQKVMEKYNWTQTALHSHMLGEVPKMLFLHWAVTGNPITIINQAKEIIMQTSTYQNLTGPTRTPTSAV